jgi:hypothetical protein
MRTSPLHYTAQMRRARTQFACGFALITTFGLLCAETLEGFFTYILIAATALLPTAFWLRAGAPGIPILPAVAALDYLYFAVPILRENVGQAGYTTDETLRAGVTVGLFLVAAVGAWRLVLGSTRRGTPEPDAHVTWALPYRLLIFGGIAIGLLFQLILMTDLFPEIGGLFGVVRAFATTSAFIACYILGHSRARGLLRGMHWALAAAGVASLTILSWSSLYLIGGMTYLLAAMLGYVITAKRIPWMMVGSALPILFLLHAGKGEMRERYWVNGYPQATPLTAVPSLFAEWIEDGVDAISAGDEEDVIDRASQLYLLLRVQRLTPEYIPYLGGETYALLPHYLVPRFLDPDKTFSQAGLALLNVRYGLQTPESVATTTIGWGVIPEAFANFGYLGVVGAGFVFGVLAALFNRWSVGATPLSLPTLLSAAALVSLINPEADFGYLLTNLWQALVATLVFYLLIRSLKGSWEPRPLGTIAIPRLSAIRSGPDLPRL